MYAGGSETICWLCVRGYLVFFFALNPLRCLRRGSLTGISRTFKFPVSKGCRFAHRKSENENQGLDKKEYSYPNGDHSGVLSDYKSRFMLLIHD